MLFRSRAGYVQEIVQASPSVTYNRTAGMRGDGIYIRGIGTSLFQSGVEPTVSAVLDGVVLGRTYNFLTNLVDIERIEILRDLRYGIYDVVVGINLLREGLDLPEVSLVAILDADKEGYLRSSTSLIQTIGRAARHVEGEVVMYADRETESMKYAISETENRRAIQNKFNIENNITPTSINTTIRDITDKLKSNEEGVNEENIEINKKDAHKLIKKLEKEMKSFAKSMEFEKAALIRDQIHDIRIITKKVE